MHLSVSFVAVSYQFLECVAYRLVGRARIRIGPVFLELYRCLKELYSFLKQLSNLTPDSHMGTTTLHCLQQNEVQCRCKTERAGTVSGSGTGSKGRGGQGQWWMLTFSRRLLLLKFSSISRESSTFVENGRREKDP